TFILTSVYVYLLYIFFFAGYEFDKNFILYLSFYDLAELFENNEFLILFWIHFLSINLFCGAWIVRDSQRFYISKIIIFFPLIITYFIGPLGLFLYWVIRIFFAKRITLFD
ncbi:ABA4-like family protein, partial [Candidatus Pelagibacter sp.]|nr:ABA4-like family protein [Candidatus Pelagibacter sp.]